MNPTSFRGNLRWPMATLLTLLVATTAHTAEPNATPPEDMAHVSAGEFIMGSEVGDADETPKHLATTGAYFIDIYEVSNTAFKEFDPSHTWRKGRDNHPAIVTWQQATAYAKSIGKRLPSETEWEKAARGIDGRMFPWGNTYDPTFIQFDGSKGIGETIAKPKSPYGCEDMAGSAMEWTSSWYQPYKDNPIPAEQYGEKYKVLKGGTTFNDSAHMRCAHRFYLPIDNSNNYLTGFRCVKDVK